MSKLDFARVTSTYPRLDFPLQFVAPELLNPAGFGLNTSNPTKKSDVYSFGVVTYQVGIAHYASVTAINVST